MLVKITMNNGTEEWGTLEARDQKTGSEFTQDLLSDDDCVTITEVDGAGVVAVMDQESYEWWDRVLERQKKVEALIEEYADRFEDAKRVAFEAAQDVNDLEDVAPAQEAALKEAFGEL